MYKKSLAYYQKQEQGEQEIAILRIINPAGLRIFSDDLPPANILIQTELTIYNGTITYNGDKLYGEGYEDILDFSGRIIDWGELQETLLPDADDLISSLQSQEISTLSVELNNADKYFSKLLGKETFISATVELLIGFRTIARNEFMEQFTGKVQKMFLTDEKITLNLRTI